jgi:preprotein translocase subunit Sss1
METLKTAAITLICIGQLGAVIFLAVAFYLEFGYLK